MKFAIPEISWHNRDPVLSADFQPKVDSNDPLRLATGGTDSHVLIWYLSTSETGSVNLEVAADLTKHLKAVNVVRWSPDGQYLASGGDEATIFIWKQKFDESTPANEGEEQYKETWVVYKILRGHMEDVLDISWSSDSSQLVSGSVDNKLIVWDVHKGRHIILNDHKGFVQGVCWDPKTQYIASTSTDRIFRVFDVATKKVVSRSSKATLPFPAEHPLHGSRLRLYHDDTLQTYFRRLQFSPDGLYIAVPSGRIEPEGKPDVKPINAVYIYTRYCLKTPVCVLPCGDSALVCRWSPLRYSPRAQGPSSRLAGGLASHARLVLAVGTKRSVLLYDTQQKTPVAIVANVHYTRLTDLTWSSDGLTLVASSTDGFCSIITFTSGELGDPLPPEPNVENKPEPMETQDEKPATQEESKPTKIDPFMKFKAPEKSPKQKPQTQIKTPVKMDVLEEVANPSWSDNSNNEIIKPKQNEPMETEVTVIEDSNDIKLVYEETEGLNSPPKAEPKKIEVKTSPQDNQFLRQAKVTDIKQPVSSTVSSPKAPRRVSFITLSSPEKAKKK